MASTRLTKSLRDKINGVLVKHATDKSDKALKAEEAKLFPQVQRDLHGADVLAKIGRLPKNWFPQSQNVSVNAGGYRIALSGAPISVPYARGRSTYQDDLKDKELIARVRDWATRVEKLKEERNQLSSQLRSLLLAASTVEKAIELMPDMRKLIAEATKVESAPVGTQALTVTARAVVDQINKLREAA